MQFSTNNAAAVNYAWIYSTDNAVTVLERSLGRKLEKSERERSSGYERGVQRGERNNGVMEKDAE